MGALTNVFQWLLERLKDWWPIRIVDADEQGVKFSGGKDVSLLPPGPHVFFPHWQKIEKVNVKYQEVDCLTQALESSDGVAFLISANVGYEIIDAVKWRTEVQSFDATIERLVRGIIAEVAASLTYADLHGPESQLAIRRAVLRKLRSVGKPWGVRFRRVAITDLARARPLRIFTS